MNLGAGDLRAPASPTVPKSVVFIESDVPDVATLIKDVDHSAQIVLLDASKDGVDAIASYLAAHKDVRDVYIFSHGSEGQLDLGTATLDSATMLGRYASDLATIKGALAPGANILVYGCDFAEGTVGDGAAHLLSQLTGAAVAASTDLTGGTAEGGNFMLEDHVGAIDAPDVLSAQIATDYVGLLAAPTTIFANAGTGLYHNNIEFLTFANTTLATGGITNGATATYTTANGSTVTVTFSNVSNATDAATFKPAALNVYASSKLYGGYNNTASSSIELYGQYNDTASFTVTFSATDKNGKSYTPNIAFSDGEVTDASGEAYTVTTNGAAFQNVETVGAKSYSLTGTGTQSVTLKNTVGGVPLLVTDNATSLGITVQIAGGKEGFVLALVDPTLSLDANASSGASANNYQTTFTEKGAAVSIGDTDTSAVEPGGTAASAKIVLTNAQAGDVLGFSGTLPSGITSTTDTSVPGQVTVTLSGAASLASYQTAIEDVTFANTSSNPSTVDRTINVTYNDGGQDSNTAVSTIHVVAVNDAPVETLPGAQSTNKDTALSISGLSVSDVDANGGTETVTLSVSDGTISLASKTGLTFSSGTGSNDTSETFTGTLSAINNAIGTVKYQPTTGYSGSDTLNFSTNDNGNTGSGGAMTASRTVAITVNNVNPTAKGTIQNQTYNDGQANVSIATSQAFSDSLGLTLTYSATGLPTGLTINATTGQITGTIDHDASIDAPNRTGSGATLDGTYTIVETASDGQGGSTTQSFTIDSKNQAPTLGTKTANQTNSDGDAVSVNAAAAFSDPNGDPLTYAATGLPAGLTISSAGTISGTVAKNAQPGTYSVTATATDDKGAATPETFTWTINDVPPARTGTLANQSYSDGQSGIAIATSQGFTDANGNALTYSATGLPAGLTINAMTGQITGTIDHDASKNAPTTTGSGATLDGKYAVVVTASDGLGGSTTQSFTIDSKNQAPTLGAKTTNQTNSDGDTITPLDASKAFSDANGDPLTYAATGLPAGLTISSAGTISGTVAKNAQPGTYSVTVTATDDKGAATETFTWTINDVPPARTGTLANQSYNDGQSGIAIATSQGFTDANGNPLTYSATGLPAGLTINATTGQITGTIDHDASKNAPTTTGSGATLDGTYAVVVTASDGQGGSATQSFMINSANGAPVVGAATAAQSSTTGQTVTPVDTSKAFSDPNGDPLTYSASNLPKGLSIDPATGIISGTVAANAASGSYVVRVLATDDKGCRDPRARHLDDQRCATDRQRHPGERELRGCHRQYRHRDLRRLRQPQRARPELHGEWTAQGPLDRSGDRPDHRPTRSRRLEERAHDVRGRRDARRHLHGRRDGLGRAGRHGAAGLQDRCDQQCADAGGADAGPDRRRRATGLARRRQAVQRPQHRRHLHLRGKRPSHRADDRSQHGPRLRHDRSARLPQRAVHGHRDDHRRQGRGDLRDLSLGRERRGAGGDARAARSIRRRRHGGERRHGRWLHQSQRGALHLHGHRSAEGALDRSFHRHHLGHDRPRRVGSRHRRQLRDRGHGKRRPGRHGDQQLPPRLLEPGPRWWAPRPPTRPAPKARRSPAVDASKAFSDPNIGDIVTYTASNLPPGLTIDPKTGIISGTIPGNATPGAYAVTVTATDDKGAATPESFVWSIDNVPPVATGTLANQTFKDSTAGIAISTAGGFTDAVNNPLLYSATGLPAGLSIDQKTGQITGTLDHDASAHGQTESGSGATLDGTYTIVVTARDALGGSATQSFTIDAKNDAPVTGTTTTPMQTNSEGDARLDQHGHRVFRSQSRRRPHLLGDGAAAGAGDRSEIGADLRHDRERRLCPEPLPGRGDGHGREGRVGPGDLLLRDATATGHDGKRHPKLFRFRRHRRLDRHGEPFRRQLRRDHDLQRVGPAERPLDQRDHRPDHRHARSRCLGARDDGDGIGRHAGRPVRRDRHG